MLIYYTIKIEKIKGFFAKPSILICVFEFGLSVQVKETNAANLCDKGLGLVP